MQKDGIFSYKVGRFEVFVMVESEGPGSAEILVGADEGLLKKLIPAEGFKRSVNAFLVRTHGAPGGDLNVLVDVGTGQPPEPIFEKIRKVGVEPERIDEALITHLHGDHFAGLLREGKPAFANAKVRLSKKEFDYFTAEKPNQNAISVLAAYGDRALTFEPGELGSDPRELLPGITPIAAYGHTPGQTFFLIEDRGEKLLIAADILHLAHAQFPRPEIPAVYDMDPAKSADVRRRFLSYAAENKIPLAGVHIAYPGLGMVEIDGEGFKFLPMK